MDGNLKFDEAIMEDLVEIYSQKHKREFRPIIPEEQQSTKYEVDQCKNKIYHLDSYRPPAAATNMDRFDHSKVLKSIAQKVRENADLFAQIEAKMRNMEAAKVKAYDIELIAKEFEFYSELDLGVIWKGDVLREFTFTPEMPLCACALLARLLRQSVSVCVKSKDITCALALHLFVQICLDAGYPATNMTWLFDPDPLYVTACVAGSAGCTAVVTRTADIESAVACLVDASQDFRYPWCLRRILVQESVFAGFKLALTRNTEIGTHHQQLATLSASTHSRGNKTFLVDYCGPMKSLASQSQALVMSYRTTSELFKLLHAHPPAYLSLWCSDISTSNEIAHGVRCGVWINNFAWLKGPHRHCHSGDMIAHLDTLYILKDRKSSFHTSEACNEVEKLLALGAVWQKTDKEKRRRKVLEVLRGSSGDYKTLIEDVTKWEPKSFVHVENGTLYQGFEEARGVFICPYDKDLKSFLSQIILSVVSGNSMLFLRCDKNTHDLIENLNKANVPVMHSNHRTWLIYGLKADWSISWYQPLDAYASDLFKTRVISCHFGETFAN